MSAAGARVLLLDQDRARWDRVLIGRGLAALERAQALGGALGPYGLQAVIAACHARARTAEETDWVRIAALYDALCELAPSPVVELNRAVAAGKRKQDDLGPPLSQRAQLPVEVARLHSELPRVDSSRP